jgi:hypothetical protein
MTPEGRVKTAVKRWLVDRGIWYFMPAANGYGKAGIPDFVCCWKGRFLAIETKAPGKIRNTTTMQDAQIEGIRVALGTAIVIDDVRQLDALDKDFA